MRRIIYTLLAVVMLALGFAAASSATGDEPKKVIVCKYVSTPGVGERLQTGDNPIQVSQNAIPGFDGTFPFEFADAQGKSLAVRYAVNNADRGTLSDCPGGDTPPPPFDACPNIEGNQPEGTKCETTPPPFDQCPSIAGDQPKGTDCNPPPPPPRCPPGMTPTAGKDGEPGNDECEGPKPPTPPVVTTPITPIVTTPTVPAPTTPAPTTPAPTTPVVTTPETTPATPDKPKAVTPKELEKELKEQAKKNGAPEAGPAPEAVPGELPKTGLPLGLVALLGAGLTAGGLALRRVR